ncbi:MAG: glycosyltransferase family A protein [Nonlabens sp.]|uniref:glycosyltransferase family A protein n=1 Tax=Nonlabens sp. TaxID=1888209 RepID=UPI00321B7C9E
MKLSEIPKSISTSLKMLLIPTSQLGKTALKKIPVVVSLTSIPTRLRTLHITIRSMMQQDYQPEKIVLWLKEDLKNQIPKQLSKLQGDLFEIRYSKYGFSHRKLIHSLKAFPDKAIITCDDDVIYQPDTLKIIFEEHLRFPNQVIGNRCRKMTYSNGEITSYGQWPFVVEPPLQSAHNMPVGAFCVLYPVGSLHEDVQNVDLFTQLAPKADDLWFKAMAILNGTKSRQNFTAPDIPVPIMGTQFVALKKINKGQDFNRVQWEQICSHYDWTKNKIETSLS